MRKRKQMSKLEQKNLVKNKYNWWVWDRFLSKENIKNINKIKSVSHKDDPATAKKTSKVKFLPFYKVNEYLQGAVERCYFSNMHNFHVDLYEFDPNFNVHHNTYSSKNKGEYQWHFDGTVVAGHDTKFTVLINVSEEEYEGGDFKLFTGAEENIKQLKNPGTMFMFRTKFLHKVEPVTKGTRKTLVFWLNGPEWK